MTRLTAEDVRPLRGSVESLQAEIREATGCSLSQLAARAVGLSPDFSWGKRSFAVVPVTGGQGVIAGFSEGVAGILRSLGLEGGPTVGQDVTGFVEALDRGVEVVYLSDDDTFVAFDVAAGVYAENSRATGLGYAQALHEACGGVAGRWVLVIGLGAVGMAAARRLTDLGAQVAVTDVLPQRAEEARRRLPDVVLVGAEEGLTLCDLVVEASPAASVIPDDWVGPESFVAAPGMPLGVSKRAAESLGSRLIHEPLAIGVASMLAMLADPAAPSDPREGA